MTLVVSVEEAKSALEDIIGQLQPDQEVVITKNEEPVARLVSIGQRKLGTMQGTVKHMASDFDAPLEDFEEYSS